MKQLQSKRKLHSLRNRTGMVLPDPEGMADEILHFWKEAMSSTGHTQEACRRYLQPFFCKFNIKLMSQLLVHPLSLHLVEAA